MLEFEKGIFQKKSRFEKFSERFSRTLPPPPIIDFERDLRQFNTWAVASSIYTDLGQVINRAREHGWRIDVSTYYLNDKGKQETPSDEGVRCYEIRMPCSVRFWYLVHPRRESKLKHVGSLHYINPGKS